MPRKSYKSKQYKNIKQKKRYPVTHFKPKPQFISLAKFMPDMLRISLDYASVVATTSTVTPATHIFRGNDIYDPDYTSSGHSPMGKDQLFTLYDRCLVVGCEITVSSTCDSGQAIVCLYNQSASFTGPGFMQEAIERKGSVYKLVQTGTSELSLKRRFSTSKSMGLSSLSTADDEWSGTSTASPAKQYSIIIATQNPDSTTSTTVRHVIKIRYSCIFFSRRKVSQS